MADRTTLQANADAHRVLALSLYEGKIADKSISASEMGAYMKILQTMGLEAPAMNTFTPSLPKSNLPSFEDEEGDHNIPFPSSSKAN